MPARRALAHCLGIAGMFFAACGAPPRAETPRVAGEEQAEEAPAPRRITLIAESRPMEVVDATPFVDVLYRWTGSAPYSTVHLLGFDSEAHQAVLQLQLNEGQRAMPTRFVVFDYEARTEVETWTQARVRWGRDPDRALCEPGADRFGLRLGDGYPLGCFTGSFEDDFFLFADLLWRARAFSTGTSAPQPSLGVHVGPDRQWAIMRRRTADNQPFLLVGDTVRRTFRTVPLLPSLGPTEPMLSPVGRQAVVITGDGVASYLEIVSLADAQAALRIRADERALPDGFVAEELSGFESVVWVDEATLLATFGANAGVETGPAGPRSRPSALCVERIRLRTPPSREALGCIPNASPGLLLRSPESDVAILHLPPVPRPPRDAEEAGTEWLRVPERPRVPRLDRLVTIPLPEGDWTLRSVPRWQDDMLVGSGLLFHGPFGDGVGPGGWGGVLHLATGRHIVFPYPVALGAGDRAHYRPPRSGGSELLGAGMAGSTERGRTRIDVHFELVRFRLDGVLVPPSSHSRGRAVPR